jgi:hypothetical protein
MFGSTAKKRNLKREKAVVNVYLPKLNFVKMKTFFVLPLLMFGLVLNAQTNKPGIKPTVNKEDEAIKKMTIDFVKAYASVASEKKDKTVFLNFFSKNASYNFVSRAIGAARVKNFTGTFEAMSQFLDGLSSNQDYKISYKVPEGQIIRFKAVGDAGTATYIVDYETFNSGKLWTKGTETVSLLFRNEEGSWKVIYFNAIAIEDQKFQGNCLCELFQSGGQNFLSKTTVPEGKEYSDKLNNFEFRGEGNDRMVRTGATTYRWLLSGEINTISATGEEQTIGKAGDKEMVILEIIKNMYSENCLDVKKR